MLAVAPARERGLKLLWGDKALCFPRRSREGAWIEMYIVVFPLSFRIGRSREGAWIEMLT